MINIIMTTSSSIFLVLLLSIFYLHIKIAKRMRVVEEKYLMLECRNQKKSLDTIHNSIEMINFRIDSLDRSPNEVKELKAKIRIIERNIRILSEDLANETHEEDEIPDEYDEIPEEESQYNIGGSTIESLIRSR